MAEYTIDKIEYDGNVYKLQDNISGYSTTDEKVSTAAVTSGSRYYPTLGTNTTSAETKYYDSKGLSYVSTQGSSNTSGSSILTLGQAASYGTANGRYGQIDLYSQTGKKGSIYQAGNYTADRTYTLPNKSGTIALTSDIPTVPTNVSAFTNDAGYITGYTETDPIFTASAAHGISSTDITNWNGKQAALVSGTNIKTVNSTSLLGSGDVAVQPTLVSGTNIKTINGNSILGSGDLPIEASNADVTQVSITVANWNATTTCTKSVTGVTTSNSIIVSPAPASISDYVSAGVYCSAQGSGTLTFTASSTPTADLVVNVMVVG